MAYELSTIGFYTTGTVSINDGSKTVTGSGTAWKDIVNSGDVLTLDDSKLYFIERVVSDTEIIIDKPYTGSASGSAYRIVLNTAAHFPSDTAAKVERALATMIPRSTAENLFLAIDGEAESAKRDALGRVIADTYVTQSDASTEYVTKVENTQKLSLSGGTMTGNLTFNGNDPNLRIKSSTDNARILIYGGSAYNTGACIWLNGKDYSTSNGEIVFDANNGTTYARLRIQADGIFQFSNSGGSHYRTVETADEKGTNYLKLADGTQFCWGNIAIDSQQTTGTETFPRAFKSELRVVFGRTWAMSPSEVLYMRSVSTTGFTWTCVSPATNSHGYDWFAIGIGAD